MIELSLLVRYLHFLAATASVGAILSTDLINSYYFLHPNRFDYDIKIEKLLSLMIWTGLFTLSVTGSIMFMGYPAAIESSTFRLKMFFVALLFLNGIFVNMWVEGKFNSIRSSDKTLRNERKFEIIAGISALVSVVSWLGALTIGFL